MFFKSILIVIDNQNGFVTTKKVKSISEKIVNLTNKDFFDVVVATQYFNNINSSQNLFIRLQNWNKLQTNKEINLVNNLKYDYCFKKDVYSALRSELEDFLESEDFRVPLVFVCGFDTECCVLKTCLDLFELGIIPVLLTSYTASNSGIRNKNAAFRIFKRTISNKCLISKKINSKNDILRIVKKFKNNL